MVSENTLETGGTSMTDTQQKSAAKKFVANWTGKGYEKGQSQAFWLELLYFLDVLL